nr:hypothetical protein [Tanacetum cinerariifolium]
MSDDRVFCLPCTCERCRRNYTDKFCSICCFESGNAFIDDLIANSFDDLPNSSDHPPQHQTHSFESYNDNPHYGYPPQEPFVYNQDSCYEQNFVDNSQSPLQPSTRCILDSCFNQDFDNNFPQASLSFPQQYLCCENCEGPHHAQPEDIQELLRKLLEDFQIINEELAKYINSSSWNHPAFYDDDGYSIQYKEYLENSSNAIAHVLPAEELDNSLSMGDEHLSTILEMESNEVIKSCVENLVLILSESEGISDDICDVPFCDNSPPLDVLTDHFELLFKFNDDCTSSDDDYFEGIDYVEASPPDSELVSLEESPSPIPVEGSDSFFEKFDTSLSYSNNSLPEFETFSDHTKETSSASTTTHADNSIKSLNDNSTPDCVLKSPSPIPVEGSDSFFEKFDTSLSYSNNSLPEFETFSDHTKETSSASTTTHADNSLPEYDSFLFKIEPDQGGELSRVVMEAILGEPHVYVPNVFSTHLTLYQDLDFSSSDDSFGSNLEISFPSGTRNKISDPGILLEVQSKRFLSRDTFSPTYVSLPFEDRHYLSFTYVI